MNTPGDPPPDYAAFIAIDWADQKHAFSLQAAEQTRRETGTLEQKPECIGPWVAQLQARFGGRPLAVAVEQSRGALIHALMSYDSLVIYPLHPTTVARFREAGLALHPHPAIEWVDDSLPALSAVRAGSRTFGLILLSAVWMHLESRQREPGMERLGELLASDGVLILSLRHGPIPAGRCMFEVSANETIALASEQGLACVLDVHTESSQAVNRAAGVTWTRLAFKRATPRSPTGCSTIATHRSRRSR